MDISVTAGIKLTIIQRQHIQPEDRSVFLRHDKLLWIVTNFTRANKKKSPEREKKKKKKERQWRPTFNKRRQLCHHSSKSRRLNQARHRCIDPKDPHLDRVDATQKLEVKCYARFHPDACSALCLRLGAITQVNIFPRLSHADTETQTRHKAIDPLACSRDRKENSWATLASVSERYSPSWRSPCAQLIVMCAG